MDDCTLWERRATSVCGSLRLLLGNSGVISFYCRFGLQPSCCVTLSLRSSVFSTSFDQWDSRVAAAAFFCEKACVTATLASDQAAAAEDELQQHCSTAGDEILTTNKAPGKQLELRNELTVYLADE